jgi:hypothetical protein
MKRGTHPRNRGRTADGVNILDSEFTGMPE